MEFNSIYIWHITLNKQRITTNVVISNTADGEVFSKQHYVIKFPSNLRQVGDFLQILRFPPPIKLTTMI